MTFSLDYDGSHDAPPESYREEITKMLVKKGLVDFQNIISADGNEEVYGKLHLKGIPAVLVYGRDGTLRKRFDNEQQEYGKEGFTYKDHIIPYVEKLVGEP